MNLDEEVARGVKARQILESDMFKEAHEKVQQDILDTFAKTDPKDLPAMQVERLRLKCLADIVRQLGEVMTSGKLAEVQIERERSAFERVKERAKQGLRRVF
jgi:hypothetical protein